MRCRRDEFFDEYTSISGKIVPDCLKHLSRQNVVREIRRIADEIGVPEQCCVYCNIRRDAIMEVGAKEQVRVRVSTQPP
jgi:hypothetical protein